MADAPTPADAPALLPCPFWPAFEVWLAAWRKEHPLNPPRLFAQFNRDPQP
jgi:hypothetical protein